MPFYCLWILYILVVLFPIVSSVKRPKKLTYEDWAYLASLFFILLIPFVIKKVNTVDEGIKNASAIYSAALSIICVYCKHIINMRKEYREIKGKLDSQFGNFINHPVLNSKKDIDGVISSMFELSHSRDIVLRFYTNSLSEIKEKGAIRIDAHLSEYTNLLGELMENAESVIGTFTKRPIKIMENQDKSTKTYLEILKSHKDIIKRICVLEKKEIKDMASDEKQAQHKKGLGEVNWFDTNVPAKQTKWTETKTFRKELKTCGFKGQALPSTFDKMIDFAIFDDILLRWCADDDDEYGAIVMLIGDEAVQLRDAMETYMSKNMYGFNSFNDLAKEFKHK